MKKLKSIFSPRKLIVWLFILVLLVTVPEITKPSMSQTEAIVTMLCVETKDDKVNIATTVLTPSQEKTANYEVFSGEGTTLGEAVSNVSLAIGKQMGFDQCQILALGENVCSQGVMPTLDFLTRTKKVDRNATLVSFSGEAEEFAQCVADMSDKKSLTLENIINYDQRYIIAQDSSIETFYKGYYSEISFGIIPLLKVETSKTPQAIEVQGQSNGEGSGSGAGQAVEQEKKFLVNDGTTSAFKNGKKTIDIEPEMIKKINLILKESKNGNVTVENVNDSLYNNATIVFSYEDKGLKQKTSFENGKPIYKIEFDAAFIIEEVIQENPGDEFLKRNKDFFTQEAIRKLEQTIKKDIQEVVDYCKANNLELLDVYRNFYHKNYKDFNEFYEANKEKYLEDITYEISVKVSTAY